MAKKSKVVAPVVSAEVVEAAEVVEQTIETTQEVVSEVVNPEVQAEQDAEEDMDVQPSGLLTQALEQVQNAKIEVPVAAKVDKNEGVGQFIRKLISEGLGNKAILDIVHEQYGNKNTTYACVAWYRNKMKKAGTDVKKASNADWVQNFAKSNGLSEDAVQELSQKVA